MARESGLVVIADQSDNAGGGAPSDSTFVLRALLERGVTNAALGMIWDPVAVSVAMSAGEGATLDLRLGGKMGPMSGDPLDLRVTVSGIIPDMKQQWTQSEGPVAVDCGDSVALHCQGIDIIVNSQRGQVFSPVVFSNFGIDPNVEASARRQIDPAFLRRLRAHRRRDHLYGRSRRYSAHLHRDPLPTRGPAQISLDR